MTNRMYSFGFDHRHRADVRITLGWVFTPVVQQVTHSHTKKKHHLAPPPPFLELRLACATQPLSPSRDFKDGRWLNNTLTVKDEWVERYYETVVNYRLGIEGDKNLQKQGAAHFSFVSYGD